MSDLDAKDVFKSLRIAAGVFQYIKVCELCELGFLTVLSKSAVSECASVRVSRRVMSTVPVV